MSPEASPSIPDRRRGCLGCAILPIILVLALKDTAMEDIKLILARRAGQPEPPWEKSGSNLQGSGSPEENPSPANPHSIH